MLTDVGEFSHFMENRILAPPVVLIVAGAIVFIVAFLGCFGAVREKPSILIAVSANRNNRNVCLYRFVDTRTRRAILYEIKVSLT